VSIRTEKMDEQKSKESASGSSRFNVDQGSIKMIYILKTQILIAPENVINYLDYLCKVYARGLNKLYII